MKTFKDLKVGDPIYVISYCCSEIRIKELKKITIHRIEKMDNGYYRLKFLRYPYVVIKASDFENKCYIKGDGTDVLIIPDFGYSKCDSWSQCGHENILYKYQIDKGRITKRKFIISRVGFYKDSEGDMALILTKEGECVVIPLKDERTSCTTFTKKYFIEGISSSVIVYGIVEDCIDKEFYRACLDVVKSNNQSIERLNNFNKDILQNY